uniref:Uncharacterized protein n=1 Tax=Leersia perrieri TaxID=77586 RepID=A0A0D9VSM1_9ORYZ
MCPRATAQHGGAAMARAAGVAAAQCFGEEEYIDLDLSSCRGLEFRVCRSAPAPACGDKPFSRGRKQQEATDAAAVGCGGGGGGGRRSTATVAPWQQQQQQTAEGGATGRRKKAATARSVHAKLQASREFFRSLFARTSCSDEPCRYGVGVRPTTTSRSRMAKNVPGGGNKPAPFGQIRSSCSGRAAPTTLRSSIEQEKLMDEEEHAASIRQQRKSFSGVIKWRPAPTAAATARPTPLQFSASTRRMISASDALPPPLKRCSSARSESEGLIQGAIAYCKRSQQQRVLARKSVSDAAFCSLQFQTQL